MIEHIKKLIESLIRYIGGSVGRKVRFLYYRNQFKSCGKNIAIDEGVFFENLKYMSFGDNIWVDKNAILIAGPFNTEDRKFFEKGIKEIEWGDLIISTGVHVAPFSLVQAHGGVKIGKNVTIASGSKIYSLSHHYKNLNSPEDKKRYSFSTMANKEDQFLIVGNVIVGDNAAIGLNSVVLPGSRIPEGTWIGVQSVVNNKVLQSNSVYSSLK